MNTLIMQWWTHSSKWFKIIFTHLVFRINKSSKSTSITITSLSHLELFLKISINSRSKQTIWSRGSQIITYLWVIAQMIECILKIPKLKLTLSQMKDWAWTQIKFKNSWLNRIILLNLIQVIKLKIAPKNW